MHYIIQYNYQFQVWTKRMKLKMTYYPIQLVFREIHTCKSNSTANEFNISDISI